MAGLTPVCEITILFPVSRLVCALSASDYKSNAVLIISNHQTQPLPAY